MDRGWIPGGQPDRTTAAVRRGPGPAAVAQGFRAARRLSASPWHLHGAALTRRAERRQGENCAIQSRRDFALVAAVPCARGRHSRPAQRQRPSTLPPSLQSSRVFMVGCAPPTMNVGSALCPTAFVRRRSAASRGSRRWAVAESRLHPIRTDVSDSSTPLHSGWNDRGEARPRSE